MPFLAALCCLAECQRQSFPRAEDNQMLLRIAQISHHLRTWGSNHCLRTSSVSAAAATLFPALVFRVFFDGGAILCQVISSCKSPVLIAAIPSKRCRDSMTGSFVRTILCTFCVITPCQDHLQVLLARKQETGEERYRRLAVAPDGLVAAAFGKTLHFLDGFHTGNVLEVIEVTCSRENPALSRSVRSILAYA